jgi:phosphate:Na+ symporter
MGISIFDVLNLLGSLGLFLVGMKVMSDSLMELAGHRMRSIMASLTANRFVAALTGLFITGLIQSSSATTLMVVSFVNAGLLQLTESLGVIMGANIGTTLTAWLIAVLGFKVSMIDIALPLMIVGFLLYMRQEKRLATLGGFVIGFSLLFIGLEFMKSAIPNLEENEALMGMIRSVTGMGLWSLLLFALIGTILTLVLQSSSATMAITLVAVSQGWLPFDAACAIVLGENIGTTITANMAAMVSSINARRAALAHMVFNIIGVIWVLALFGPFLDLVSNLSTSLLGASPMTTPDDAPVGLAVFHTTFNIINTSLLIGLVGPLAIFVTRLLPDRPEPVPETGRARYLEESALRYPETAIHSCLKEVRRLYREPVLGALLQGINVPPRTISSETDIEGLVQQSREVLSPDLDEITTSQLQPIYRQLADYGNRIHEKHKLEADAQTRLRNIGFAARDALLILGDIGQLNHQMNEYLNHDNERVRGAFDTLRAEVLQLIVVFQDINHSESKEVLEGKLVALDDYLKTSDIERADDFQRLLDAGQIDAGAAAALFAASGLVRSIGMRLIRVERHVGDAVLEYDAVSIEEEPAAA